MQILQYEKDKYAIEKIMDDAVKETFNFQNLAGRTYVLLAIYLAVFNSLWFICYRWLHFVIVDSDTISFLQQTNKCYIFSFAINLVAAIMFVIELLLMKIVLQLHKFKQYEETIYEIFLRKINDQNIHLTFDKIKFMQKIKPIKSPLLVVLSSTTIMSAILTGFSKIVLPFFNINTTTVYEPIEIDFSSFFIFFARIIFYVLIIIILIISYIRIKINIRKKFWFYLELAYTKDQDRVIICN